MRSSGWTARGRAALHCVNPGSSIGLLRPLSGPPLVVTDIGHEATVPGAQPSGRAWA
jgi:hypothetical protein